MNIALFGAPGAGKGTQSALLVERKDFFHISTGDLFRAAIKNQTDLGQQAKSFMDKGELVPDTIVIGMVEEVFDKLKGKSFILDGFPRTVPQAEALDNMLAQHQIALGKAIFLEVPKEKIVNRLTGRRVCKDCGAVYHIKAKPPKTEGVCDECGSNNLIQRDDDKEEVISTRLDAYEASTSPLKGYFQGKAKYVSIDGDGSAEEVFQRLEEVL